ncbi:hypothetical protein BCR34DRAFT_571719 [Clohesyomyces aquaticus]|uniref:Uncharacterized protein n=1 Tax=Clohesyomyces aquaticus TaxID=1231657 RepID=A0A1Y1Z6Q2_9PLEO|nr:hypothetical protein BCR34DRAFT_571719 [Clohesyomyces aquaticus]
MSLGGIPGNGSMGDRTVAAIIPPVTDGRSQPPSSETSLKLRKSVPSLSHRKVRCRFLRPPDTRLSKPPRVHEPREATSGKKLQRRKRPHTTISITPILYLLYYHPYPYGSTSGKLLGVFSDLYTAAAAAGACGATVLPHESSTGELTYLIRTGRLKISAKEIQGDKIKSPGPSQERTRGSRSSSQMLRNYHEGRISLDSHLGADRIIYLVIEESQGSTSCSGAFIEKEKAWHCCVESQHRACSSLELEKETTWADSNGMAHIKGRIKGIGWLHWYLAVFRLDELVEDSFTTR